MAPRNRRSGTGVGGTLAYLVLIWGAIVDATKLNMQPLAAGYSNSFIRSYVDW
jgi:hypothetical protein